MIADYLIARAKRTPYFHLTGYMNRWWLVPYTYAGSAGLPGDGTGAVSWRRPVAKLLQMLGVAVRVHEILRSDIGRDPHDHPWSYLTIVLKGGYVEERYDVEGQLVSARWHGPGSVLFRRAGDLHKLRLPRTEPTGELGAYAEFTATTLFITGRYRQRWGFQTATGKVPHDLYRGARNGGLS